MKTIKYFVMLLMCFLTIQVDTYRILGIFPLGFKSHNMFFQALMKSLARKGHQVDVISHYELLDPPKNYTTIINLANIEYDFPKVDFYMIQEIKAYDQDFIQASEELYGLRICKLMGHEKIQKFLRNPPRNPPYDLIITEGLGISCYLGLGPFFNVPIVTATASLEYPWISLHIGNPLSTAFFPTLSASKSEIKTFWDRLQNTVKSLTNIYKFLGVSENQSETMRKYLKKDIPTVREVERMVALSIVNTHPIIQGIRPTTPAFIEVGGLHIQEDDSKFTNDLKQWMDESKNGVVYVSFGSIVPMEMFPKQKISSLYSSFRKLAPTRVLMKSTEGFKFPPGLPDNVATMHWIPQIPVLSHNNTRAFITHGGIHSIQEAVYFAVPIIGIPRFYDQNQNVNILVNKKMGIQLSSDKINEKSLDEALMKILHDPKYREASKNYSRLFRDRDMSPRDKAVYWIEYVIRNGDKVLRSPAVDMYWWQVALLDVYAFFLFFFILVFYTILIIFQTFMKLLFRKTAKSQFKIE